MFRRRATALRWALLLLLLAAFLLYFLAGGRQTFSLASLKAAHSFLLGWVEAAPLLSAAAYMLAYLMLVAVALPVSGLMMLAGGALFGWLAGALLAIVGYTGGATLSMIGARFLGRRWVQRRWPDFAARVNRGIARDGDVYLVSLRLAPGIPFVLINIIAGLTSMPVRRFALLTMISGLPGCFVFAYAGEALATVDSVADVLTVRLAITFLGLAALPLLGRAVARAVAARG